MQDTPHTFEVKYYLTWIHAGVVCMDGFIMQCTYMCFTSEGAGVEQVKNNANV